MSAFTIDGALTTPQISGGARKSFPFAGDLSSFIVDQDYQVMLDDYVPPTISTPHSLYTDAYLIKDSPLENLGGGIVKFTRTWAQVPASRDEPGTYAFAFPGLKGAEDPPYNQYWVLDDGGRDGFTQNTDSRFRHEYFLCAPGQPYESPDEIDILPAQIFTVVSNPSVRVTHLLPAGVYWSDSTPTREAYEALMAGGPGLGTGAQAGEFIAEDSVKERWMGDIYVRITRYIKAK